MNIGLREKGELGFKNFNTAIRSIKYHFNNTISDVKLCIRKIMDFPGYVPKKSSKLDKLGTRTQLWQLCNDVRLQRFLRISNVPMKVLHE